jgi:tetratricopeptide (TPR) repeat protein
LDTDEQTGQTDKEAKAAIRFSDHKTHEEILSWALSFYSDDIHERHDDFIRAFADLNLVIETTSDADLLVQAYGIRALLHQIAGHPIDMFDDLNWLVEHRASDSDYSWRASEFVERGRITEAIADLTMAFSLNPFYLGYLSHRAGLYYSLMEYGKAIHDCTTIIKLNEKYNLQYRLDGAYYLRAKAYFMIDEIDCAVGDAMETRKLRDQPGYKDLEDFMDEFGYLRTGLAG